MPGTILAVLLVFTFAACSSPSGGDGGGVTSYSETFTYTGKTIPPYTPAVWTLTIKSNSAVPAVGDPFELTDGHNVCSGKVADYTHDEGYNIFIRLQPIKASTTMVVTIKPADLSLYTMTSGIVWDNGFPGDSNVVLEPVT